MYVGRSSEVKVPGSTDNSKIVIASTGYVYYQTAYDANYPLPRSVILFSTDQFSTLSRSSDLLHSDHSFFSF